jgi:hypothetical protein
MLRTNESYSLVHCGIQLTHISKHLGPNYHLELEPIVYEVQEVSRKNQKSDCVIIRMRTKRSVLVVEFNMLIAVLEKLWFKRVDFV